MGVARDDVNTFWEGRSWDLTLPGDGAPSNCMYCFLKGGPTLRRVHQGMAAHMHAAFPGFGALAGTPCDVEWWAQIERTYGRVGGLGDGHTRTLANGDGDGYRQAAQGSATETESGAREPRCGRIEWRTYAPERRAPAGQGPE